MAIPSRFAYQVYSLDSKAWKGPTPHPLKVRAVLFGEFSRNIDLSKGFLNEKWPKFARF
jgi:hypothetical protein